MHASFGLVAGRPSWSTIQRALLSGNGPGRPGRSTGSVDRTESLLSVSSSGRPSGGPAREPLLSGSRLGRPLERSTGGLNGHKFDQWPVDRPVDRKGNSALSSCQRADFLVGYKYPLLWLISPIISREKIFTSFKCFQQKFLGSKDLFFILF